MSEKHFMFIGVWFLLLALIVVRSNSVQTKIMQKWDTCVSQQKVEGAPYEEFMVECMSK